MKKIVDISNSRFSLVSNISIPGHKGIHYTLSIHFLKKNTLATINIPELTCKKTASYDYDNKTTTMIIIDKTLTPFFEMSLETIVSGPPPPLVIILLNIPLGL